MKDITGFLLYLKNGVEVSLHLDSRHVEDLKKVILGAVDNINKGNFNCKPNYSCEKHCTYYDLCIKNEFYIKN